MSIKHQQQDDDTRNLEGNNDVIQIKKWRKISSTPMNSKINYTNNEQRGNKYVSNREKVPPTYKIKKIIIHKGEKNE